jgi:hypothetical protein
LSGFDETFFVLRQVMLSASAGQIVTKDLPGDLVIRTQRIDTATGAPGWFGTVTIKRSYVAYHLMALYYEPALADAMSEALQKRRQGKTCFNFKKVDANLFEELAALTQRASGAEAVRERGAASG